MASLIIERSLLSFRGGGGGSQEFHLSTWIPIAFPLSPACYVMILRLVTIKLMLKSIKQLKNNNNNNQLLSV